MRVSSEFSKYAIHYDSYNSIQNKVIDKLLSLVTKKPEKILDIGCGSGALCKKISWNYQYFRGIDFAQGMLELHPKSKNIEVIYGDFNDIKSLKTLVTQEYDYIFSASALQWAKNLESIFSHVQTLNTPFAFAIFSANTFKTLHETASLTSLLKTADEINTLQKKYFNAHFEIVNYQLEFHSTREMFRYIKQSGVSGSRKVLDYKQTKQLLETYPISYLEFEVVFIVSR